MNTLKELITIAKYYGCINNIYQFPHNSYIILKGNYYIIGDKIRSDEDFYITNPDRLLITETQYEKEEKKDKMYCSFYLKDDEFKPKKELLTIRSELVSNSQSCFSNKSKIKYFLENSTTKIDRFHKGLLDKERINSIHVLYQKIMVFLDEEIEIINVQESINQEEIIKSKRGEKICFALSKILKDAYAPIYDNVEIDEYTMFYVTKILNEILLPALDIHIEEKELKSIVNERGRILNKYRKNP